MTQSKASKKYGPVGQEDINTSAIRPGFIKIIQKTNATKAVPFGALIDSDTGEIFGEEITVIPVKKYLDWVKFTADYKLDDRSIDGLKWNGSKKPLTDDEKWQCACINFLVFIEGHDSDLPNILSFRKTSFKYGQKMDSIISKNIMINKEPIFGRKFKIFTATEKNDMGEFSVIKAELLPGEPTEPMMEKAFKTAESFTKLLAQDRKKLLEIAEHAEPSAPAPEPKAKKNARKY